MPSPETSPAPVHVHVPSPTPVPVAAAAPARRTTTPSNRRALSTSPPRSASPRAQAHTQAQPQAAKKRSPRASPKLQPQPATRSLAKRLLVSLACAVAVLVLVRVLRPAADFGGFANLDRELPASKALLQLPNPADKQKLESLISTYGGGADASLTLAKLQELYASSRSQNDVLIAVVGGLLGFLASGALGIL